VLPLARSIADNDGLMPGERIVIFLENNKGIVLEGNRRTCACQMFLNRALIPVECVTKYPQTTDVLKMELSHLEVDIIPTREEAKRFLAVRHIERAREWSPIAKMRFCYEDFVTGKTVGQIKERTGISIGNINKFIRNYKILLRGLNYDWTIEEKAKLNLLELNPSKLIRIFELNETKKVLQLYYDNDYNLKSTLISDSDLDLIVITWAKKAFIEDEMDTRTAFGVYIKDGKSEGACAFISSILDCYFRNENSTETNRTNNSDTRSNTSSSTSSSTTNESTQPGGNQSTNTNSNESNNAGNSSASSDSPNERTTSNLPFFSTLNMDNIDATQNTNRGIIAVVKELQRISSSTSFINNYPLCTAFIIRALIEQSLKYHARKNGYWAQIMRQYASQPNQGGEPQLSFIINQYCTNIVNWIPDVSIRRLFNVVFNFRIQTEKLNLVVHTPESYMLTPDSLKAIPGEGLLEIANFLLR
jgi:hypothetical protein